MKKSIRKYVIIFYTAAALGSVSCGKAGVSGVFIPEKKSQIKSVEFKDGRARFTYSFINFTQGFIKCRFSSNRVYIDDPIRGEIPFKVINSDTLECEHPSLAGLYRKEGK